MNATVFLHKIIVELMLNCYKSEIWRKADTAVLNLFSVDEFYKDEPFECQTRQSHGGDPVSARTWISRFGAKEEG